MKLPVKLSAVAGGAAVLCALGTAVRDEPGGPLPLRGIIFRVVPAIRPFLYPADRINC